MAKTLEYDEKGYFFGYFVICIFGFALAPLTYYILSSFFARKSTSKCNAQSCQCQLCTQKKVKAKKSSFNSKNILILFGLALLWLIFLMMIYKIKTSKPEETEANIFNPFAVLGIDETASLIEVKKAYRKLALKLHPDRGGDVDSYIKLAKAYSALTNSESRSNWEKYGDPDGPKDSSFGIALPSWLVSKKNSSIVLLVYFLIIMIGIPTAVAVWWYRSKSYFNSVLSTNTIEMFCYFIRLTPDMMWKRVITILCAAFEFSPQQCKYMKIKRDDLVELVSIGNSLQIKNKEKKNPIFNQPYVFKSRILLYAFLNRYNIANPQLQIDQDKFIHQFIALLGEFINILSSFIIHALRGNVPRAPSCETLVNCMKLCPRIIQAITPGRSPLLQLPHFSNEFIDKIQRRKKFVKNVQTFVSLPEKDRSLLLKDLDSSQVVDIYNAIESMPSLDSKMVMVVGEEINPISVEFGSLVSIVFTITRNSLSTLLGKIESETSTDKLNSPSKRTNIKNSKVLAPPSDSHNQCNGSQIDASSNSEKQVEELESEPQFCSFEEVTKINNNQEEPMFYVHAPYYPNLKKEGWWAYIVNKTTKTLEAGPIYFHMSNPTKKVIIQMYPPPIIGVAQYLCYIQSDSYIDFIYEYKLSINVSEIKPSLESHPQWEFSEDEVEEELLTESEDNDK